MHTHTHTHGHRDCLPGGILHHAGTNSWLAYVFFIIHDDFSNMCFVSSESILAETIFKVFFF